jgi:ABC-type hemin transport system substrate-binding protein
MATSVKTKSVGSVRTQTTACQEPKKLSKIGIWRRENPEGIFTVNDRRAVNQ